MVVTPFEHGLDLAKPTKGYRRSKGVHASELYGAFYKAYDPSRYNKKDTKGKPLPFDVTKMELGTSFEEVLESALIERLLASDKSGTRPGEFTSPEGIIYSPDFIFFNGEDVLGEFKCTWYSMKNAPLDKKFEKWWTQIKMYCHWLGLTKARLYVLFVNGNYKPPSPVLRAWEAEFSPHELREEAEMVLNHARREGLVK